MTDEVAPLVLRNNYLQTLALSLAEKRKARRRASASAAPDAALEAQRPARPPSSSARRRRLAERRRSRRGLTRPELAVLLAYAKLTLHDDLLASACRTIPI
jgi:glutamate dehydrogenase